MIRRIALIIGCAAFCTILLQQGCGGGGGCDCGPGEICIDGTCRPFAITLPTLGPTPSLPSS